MTNIIATIAITLSTNWTTVGTMTPVGAGAQQYVQSGKLITNTMAVIEWNGKTKHIMLQRNDGPQVCSRFVPKPERERFGSNAQHNIQHTNILVGPGLMITNKTGSDIRPRRAMAPKDNK